MASLPLGWLYRGVILPAFRGRLIFLVGRYQRRQADTTGTANLFQLNQIEPAVQTIYCSTSRENATPYAVLTYAVLPLFISCSYLYCKRPSEVWGAATVRGFS